MTASQNVAGIPDAGDVPVAELVRQLDERITRNQLAPGSGLSIEDIAETSCADIATVQEAFSRLVDTGLLERAANGIRVARICLEQLRDHLFLREALEVEVVRIVASGADSSHIAELREQIVRQKLVSRRAPEHFLQLDGRFHRTLLRAAGRDGLWPQLETLKARTDRPRFLNGETYMIDQSIAQHSALVDRIALRDVPGAEAAMRGHLREVIACLPELMGLYPDAFSRVVLPMVQGGRG